MVWSSGSGFISSELYEHGFFSASIKLPRDYTAGVVVAFYVRHRSPLSLSFLLLQTSNGDIFPNTHDELDLEFLGNVRGEDWRIQTNVYGNGSTARGREERYLVPFDPTEAAHRYSILWTPDYIMYSPSSLPSIGRHGQHVIVFCFWRRAPRSSYRSVSLGTVRGHCWMLLSSSGHGCGGRAQDGSTVVMIHDHATLTYFFFFSLDFSCRFYIDDVPIREVVRSDAMGGDFPSKPMSVYATIWDGSSWATSYGKIKINYKYAPYVSEFSDLILRGCRVDPIQQVDTAERCAEAVEELMSADYALLTPMKRAAMRRFRERYMIYSFCYDHHRYGNFTFPDCDYVSPEHTRFGEWGDNRFPPKEVRRSRRRVRKPSPINVPSSE
ncbi:hypothetical protein GW17_00049740 [Ensete ventricosum]|nr:hypothetical protein GW17_00049740 [Ensete ventricosum]